MHSFHSQLLSFYFGNDKSTSLFIVIYLSSCLQTIGFSNKIFHPNIDEHSGTVCLDVINQTWSPMYELVNVFDVFLPQLLLYPNASDPLNGEAAALFSSSKEDYNAKIRDHVRKYATLEYLKKMKLITDDDLEDDEDETSGLKRGKREMGGKSNGAVTANDCDTANKNSDNEDDDDDTINVMDSDDDDSADDSVGDGVGL
eukprot:m.61031 g.61031  ORF g.61031 m.61031 type:complete len:200 (-) comp11374_c0_seq2:1238-1837(-)